MADLTQTLLPTEKERLDLISKIVPKGFHSVLDVGARDGRFSKLFTHYFDKVIALDLEKPDINLTGIESVKGDVTRLDFPDNYFDVVCCLEVLEHIPAHLLQTACSEIYRVAKYKVVIGVPYKQDIRVGRCTCHLCGKINPPWGHINKFDENKLSRLFSKIKKVHIYYLGTSKARTNFLSTILADLAGNPYGTYDQQEKCIYCGAKMAKPEKYTILQKIFSVSSFRIRRLQSFFTQTRPYWIHVVFDK